VSITVFVQHVSQGNVQESVISSHAKHSQQMLYNGIILIWVNWSVCRCSCISLPHLTRPLCLDRYIPICNVACMQICCNKPILRSATEALLRACYTFPKRHRLNSKLSRTLKLSNYTCKKEVRNIFSILFKIPIALTKRGIVLYSVVLKVYHLFFSFWITFNLRKIFINGDANIWKKI